MKSRILGTCCLVSLIMSVVVFVMIVRGTSALFFAKADTQVDPISVTVEPGENVTTVAQKLEELGLLEAVNWFRWYGRVTGRAKNIGAGVYEVHPGMSILSLYELLKDGRSAEKDITIIEGWTLDQIDVMLVTKGIAGAGEVGAIVQDGDFRGEFEFLSEIPEGLDIEGYVFPETYRVFADASAKDILRKALLTFEKNVYLDKREEIERSRHTLFEIVTIASILEREVRGLEDKKKVADLIERRLDIGMPLQMDSTVNYVTGKNHPGILLSDRDVESPYNTYKYAGLPVGPISNPGIESITAVLDPTPNPYYFFLTTPSGEVIYSKTNDEHVANKYKYLK